MSKPWEKYLVGDEPCTYLRIEQSLSKSTSVSLLWQKLPDVARTLEFSGSGMIVTKVMLNIQSHSGHLQEILTNWRSKKPTQATLGNLINVLRNHQLNECAEVLIKEFGT
ncbi:unnamed protein product [Orchesella dallaii]|uniref:Death domain-containing protein n=1 Tax=Orchesella dallaii TaxID=48710 RepID=A0ABP1RAT3_9HEXA